MFEYMELLTPTEAENVKKTIQELFRHTCILQVKCDPATLNQRDNPKYHTCTKHREFISDYLEVLGVELLHDPQEHYFRVRGDGLPAEKMSLTTTQLILLLKLIYHDKIMGEGLKATVTSLEEIREYGKNTNLIVRKLTRQEWQEALILMKNHQLIELPGGIGSLEDHTPIYIYSTIQMFCAATEIGALVKRYQMEEEETGDDEDAEEDHNTDVSE